jgi:hypothetical protein
LATLEELGHNVERLLVLLLSEEIAGLEYLVHHMLVLTIKEKGRLKCLNLRFEEAEGVGIGDLETDADVHGQLFIRLAQLFAPMGIRTVLAEVTLLVLLEILANLRLVVVVGNVQHFVLHFYWQLLEHKYKSGLLLCSYTSKSQKETHDTLRSGRIEWQAVSPDRLMCYEGEGGLELVAVEERTTYLVFSPQFLLAVSKMAAITLDTVLVLGEVFAKCGLVEIIELLASCLLLALHDGFLAKLPCRRGSLALGLSIDSKAFSALMIFLQKRDVRQ